VTPILVLCAVLGAAPAPEAPAPTPLPIRRFALVAGANDGGPDRVHLRYARSDAERVAQLLERLGGVAAADEILLLDPDDAALRSAFRAVEGRIRAARATHRAELVLYYSGHSDEQGLLLRGTRVPYPEVRRWLESVGAQVRIAIIDSCSSGALTRQKGGQRAPPFLIDTSSAVKGHAILTSSAEDEASQESDRIGASFFTHYLITGLRGAADTSQDGKVTVNEAYQFAFGETLARTERTRSGAQHPAYDIQLAGSGDVVLTDLRGTEAALVFPEQASGRYFVRDRDGRLVAELRKVAGRQVELGVEPGAYRVVRDDGVRLAEAQLTVASGARSQVPLERLTPIGREVTALRGGALADVPVDVSVFPPLSLNGDRATTNRLQLGLFGARTTRLRGFGLAPVLWAEEDVTGVQLGALWASAGGPVEGAQISGVAGAAGALRGAQLSGVANVVRGDFLGVQIGGVASWTGAFRAEGAQATGAGATFRGAQLSGVLGGIRGDLVGAQLGGVASWIGGHAVGLQLSPVVNVVGSIEGAQISTVNVAGEVRGVQLAVVNVSTGAAVRGWQVGVVNVANHVDGIPLGLVNLVRDGWHRVLVISNEDGTPTVGYAGGTGVFHTTLEASLLRTGGGARGWGAFGPGVHFRLGGLGLDLDLLAGRTVDDAQDYGVITLRALATVPLTRTVALVAGPTANVLLGRQPDSMPSVVGPFGELSRLGDRPAWLGLQAGVRL
jgi:hypothetical protein